RALAVRDVDHRRDPAHRLAGLVELGGLGAANPRRPDLAAQLRLEVAALSGERAVRMRLEPRERGLAEHVRDALPDELLRRLAVAVRIGLVDELVAIIGPAVRDQHRSAVGDELQLSP